MSTVRSAISMRVLRISLPGTAQAFCSIRMWRRRSGRGDISMDSPARGRRTWHRASLVLALPFERQRSCFNTCCGRGCEFARRPDRKPPSLATLQCASLVRSRDTNLDHAVLLDRELHWMYNKGRLQPGASCRGATGIVVSASPGFAALSREQAIDQAVKELAEFFPRLSSAKLEKAALVKEVRATFGVPPASMPRGQAPCRRGPIASSRRLDATAGLRP